MAGTAEAGFAAVFAFALAANALLVGYRSPRVPAVRTLVDRVRRRVTGREDWNWLRLEHLMIPLAVVAAANVAWNLSQLHCPDDSYALLASGRAALHGGDPFLVSYCGGPGPDPIPYGLSAVGLNAVAAGSGSVVGVWVVWELVGLAVVPLVWLVAGTDRRYVATLAAFSVAYLPNLATNIGVDNAIVPVAVLLGIYAAAGADGRSIGGWLLGAFASTARFPAFFGLLGAPASETRRLARGLLALVVFGGAAALSWRLWGWNAIEVVYLKQFSRVPPESLNAFALLLKQGWLHPSLLTATVQALGVLAAVLYVHLRRSAPAQAAALPMIAVLAFSQYVEFHFVVWLVPLVLVDSELQPWLLAYGALAWLDETAATRNLAALHGIWWPAEILGLVLTALLVRIAFGLLRPGPDRPPVRR